MVEYDVPQYIVVYCSLAFKIVCGQYHIGDKLPSRAELSLKYEASELTIRKALSKLEENGYITLQRGRAPLISENYLLPRYRNQAVIRLSQKKASICDIFRSYSILLPPFVYFALCKLSVAEIQKLLKMIPKILQKSPLEMARLSDIVFRKLLNKNCNKDLLYYFINTQVFIFLTLYLSESALWVSQRKALLMKLSEHIQTRLANSSLTLEQIKAGFQRCFQDALEELDTICPVCREDPTPQLLNFRHYESKYVTLSYKLMEGIFCGTYRAGELLPSDASAAESFGVSIMTARKAYQLLNQVGFVQTIPQVGTRVIFGGNTVPVLPFAEPELAQHVRIFLDTILFWRMIMKELAIVAADNPALSAALPQPPAPNQPPLARIPFLIQLLDKTVKCSNSETLYAYFHVCKPIIFLGGYHAYACRPEKYVNLVNFAYEAAMALMSGNKKEFASGLTNIFTEVYSHTRSVFSTIRTTGEQKENP